MALWAIQFCCYAFYYMYVHIYTCNTMWCVPLVLIVLHSCIMQDEWAPDEAFQGLEHK